MALYLPKYTLWGYFIVSYHALYYGIFDFFIIQNLIFISSLIYHNNLIANFRVIDMFIAISSCIYHIFMFFWREVYRHNTVFIYLMGGGIVCYGLGHLYNSNNWHAGIHILSIIGGLFMNYAIYCLANESK